MEKISIIVPVYNVEPYLGKCIDSLISQTYKNLEILLIDDGSTDNSGKICDEYAEKDGRIKVIHKENKGLSATRNLGVEVSSGQYLVFIDSDDYVTEDYCETLINAIKEENCDVASVDLRMVRDDGYQIVTSDDINFTNHDSKLQIFSKEEILKEVLLRKSFKNYVCTKMYNRKIFEKCKFKDGINYEDILFMYEVSKVIDKIAYVNKECYIYLKRGNSITATCSDKNLNDFLDVVIYRYNDIEKHNPNLKKYNIYALLESIISVSIKYVIANKKYSIVEEKSNYIFEILSKITEDKDFELELLPLLNKSQKAGLYLLSYNKELFYNFLKARQNMKKKGTFVEANHKRLKICLLCDAKGWAFDMIAQTLKKELYYKYDIRIEYFDMYNNPDMWFECLEKNKDCDLIHVFWRKTLLLFDSDEFKHKVKKAGYKLDSYIHEINKKLSTCVCDFLYIDDEKDIKLYQKVFNEYATSYYVINTKLLKIYKSIKDYKKPQNVIFDICDWDNYKPLNLDRFKQDNINNRSLIIGWVGNSERKVNGIDLKGLHTIIKPVIEELKKEGYDIKEHYADRNIKCRTKEEMPIYYSEIDLCICASIHEGTPLPVLEAMSCGVPIVTTDVGVTRDALGKLQQEYIIGDRQKGNNDENIRKKLKEILIEIYNDRSILECLSKENLDSIIKYDDGRIIKSFAKYFDSCLMKIKGDK